MCLMPAEMNEKFIDGKFHRYIQILHLRKIWIVMSDYCEWNKKALLAIYVNRGEGAEGESFKVSDW